ncbi:MAG: YkgJ family cysteine cluster protein [Saprospiraceae bacterium]|nr:YkgJ family cysteine cluster protein [Saprospiraceae bacterium]
MGIDLMQEWSENAKTQKEENKAFLKTLLPLPKLKILPTLLKAHTEVFEAIDCLKCANCCRTSPAIVIKSDINRLAKHFNQSPKQFIRQHVLTDINGDMVLNGVPCSFLNDDNTCAVYEIRPDACRRYPHTDEADFGSRPALNLANTIVCPAAYHIVNLLKSQLSSNDI